MVHVRGVAVWLTVAVQPSGVKAIVGPTTPVLHTLFPREG